MILLSLFLLVILAVVCSVNPLLIQILEEAHRIRQILCAEKNAQPAGPRDDYAMHLPAFTATLLDEPDTSVTDATLRGKDSLILFVNAIESLTMRSEVFSAIVYSLWTQTDRDLLVVCDGSEQQCRELRERFGLRKMYGNTLKILIDIDGRLTGAFGLTKTPGAMSFDPDGKATRVGGLASPDVRELDATAPSVLQVREA
jgi:hypothetical protein